MLSGSCSLSYRENVPGSRPKPHSWVYIHVLQRETHRLASGPHPLGQSLQPWERCCKYRDLIKDLSDSHQGNWSILLFFFFTETLWASEVQPTCAVQALSVSACGTSFFSCRKNSKAHSESHTFTVIYNSQLPEYKCWPLFHLCVCVQDKDFLKPLLHKMHVNPPAEVSTSMKVMCQGLQRISALTL